MSALGYPAHAVPVTPADRDMLVSRGLVIEALSYIDVMTQLEVCTVIVTPEVYAQLDALGVERAPPRISDQIAAGTWRG